MVSYGCALELSGFSPACGFPHESCDGPSDVISLPGGSSAPPMRRCTSAWDWCSAALTAAAPSPPLTSLLRSTVMLVDSQATTSSAVTDPSARAPRLCCCCCFCCCAADNQQHDTLQRVGHPTRRTQHPKQVTALQGQGNTCLCECAQGNTCLCECAHKQCECQQ